MFRAGGGIYYNPNQTNSYTFLNTNPPYTTILTCNYSVGLTPPTLSNPFGSPGVCPTAPTAGTIVTDPWNQPTPRMNQWSAGLERQFWSGGGLEVQYLGSHSYHLDRSFYNNTPLLPGPGAVNSRRPNPLFGVIRTINNDEIANYESMSVIFHQRLTHGLQMLASYTWSHTLDVTTDSNGGGTPMIPYNWKDDYGNSNWDIRHRFVASFVYDIPFFQISNPVLKGVFTKWQTNGISDAANRHSVQRHDSVPTPPTPPSSGTYRPDLVHTPQPTTADAGIWSDASTRPLSRWRICIPLHPTNYAYGNAGRNLLHGPGAETVEFLSVQELPDQGAPEVPAPVRDVRRCSTTPNFSNPSSTFSTSAFGNITTLNTSAPGTRNIQFGGKLMF